MTDSAVKVGVYYPVYIPSREDAPYAPQNMLCALP